MQARLRFVFEEFEAFAPCSASSRLGASLRRYDVGRQGIGWEKRVSIRQKIKKVFLIGAIALALFSGAPLRPDQIEDLLFQTRQTRIEQIRRDDAKDGDGLAAERTDAAD